MINQPAPDFNLPDLAGHRRALQDFRGQVAIVNFWSAECPWAARADRTLIADLQTWGSAVSLIAIASNANEAPELLARVAAERGLPLVLRDAGQHVADLYDAQTTPHLFVIDAAGMVRYQGAFDDVTFRQRTPTRAYLHQAVSAVLAGQTPEPAQTPPYGCALVRYAD
jgi:peroxiredoxin